MQVQAATAPERNEMPAVVHVNGVALVADHSGALWHRGQRMLIVSDLHLEKGSSYARGGQLLPPYDTIATLNRLSAAVARLAPRRIVFLGDAFHDAYAGERIPQEAVAAIEALGAARDLIWIAGNHDPLPPAQLPGERCAEVALDGLFLRHLPARGDAIGEIAGHLHPVARVQTRAAIVRRACFISDSKRLLLPAFGAYTGGLNIREPGIAGLFDTPQVHVLGERRVLPIALARCV